MPYNSVVNYPIRARVISATSQSHIISTSIGTILVYCKRSMETVAKFKFIAELPRPEGPPSGAPYSYGKEKEIHQ